MPDLLLYHFQSCPYCAKVRNYLEKRGIKVPMKDTHADNAARDELVNLAGKTQVPCLVIDGNPMHESDDIIQWFEDNWK